MAGGRVAVRAADPTRSDTSNSVTGSIGVTPNSNEERIPFSENAPSIPIAFGAREKLPIRAGIELTAGRAGF